MDASGKDDVFLETVGVGQAEVDIIDHADTVVLVLMPGSGDSIQALKAGVMEIPDVIVVNKADHPLTDTMVREIRGVLSLGPQKGWRVPILRTEAAQGRGRRGARREDRRAPRAHRGRGHARRAPPAQPHERGAGAGHRPAAPQARGALREDDDGAGAARRGRRAPARPGERRGAAARARDSRTAWRQRPRAVRSVSAERRRLQPPSAASARARRRRANRTCTPPRAAPVGQQPRAARRAGRRPRAVAQRTSRRATRARDA